MKYSRATERNDRLLVNHPDPLSPGPSVSSSLPPFLSLRFSLSSHHSTFRVTEGSRIPRNEMWNSVKKRKKRGWNDRICGTNHVNIYIYIYISRGRNTVWIWDRDCATTTLDSYSSNFNYKFRQFLATPHLVQAYHWNCAVPWYRPY